MRATRSDDAALVAAAQAGDRGALEEVLRGWLPLVHTIVRRGMGEHPDVDDVVQDTLLRALRQLPSLRSPEHWRSWVAAIALRQVGTQLRRAGRGAARTAALEEALDLPDERLPSQEATALSIDMSRQRRQVERAGRWLDPDDRALLPLWWLQVAGELTRSDVAAAVGTSSAHAGVRLQRMRSQLELSRRIVAALDARPRCPRLDQVAASWDGEPGPLWRKRIGRHVRSCPACTRALEGMVPTERLLPTLALLPVPAGLAATTIGNIAAAPAVVAATGAGFHAGVIGAAAQAVAAHPIAAAATAGALAIGATVTATQRTTPDPAPPPAVAAPVRTPAPREPSTPPTRPPAPNRSTPAARPSPEGTSAPPGPVDSLRIGPVSLEAENAPGLFVATVADLGVLRPAGARGDRAERDRATLNVVPGLDDAACFSFRARDGRYLRHSSWRLRLSPDDGTGLFRGDATFCARAGAGLASVRLESSNYPGWFVRHRDDEMWVDQSDGSKAFGASTSFLVRPPLSG